MSIPTLYSLNTMTVTEWFNMLANQKKVQEEEEPDDLAGPKDSGASLVYEVDASEPFFLTKIAPEDLFDDMGQVKLDVAMNIKDGGVYYMRALPQQVEEMRSNNPSVDFQIRKLSSSEIVYLSDIYSMAIQNDLTTHNPELKKRVVDGEASRYFTKELDVTVAGLETMRDRVWTKYFDQGVMGFLYRIFSAIANFFTKYREYTTDTGIIWPGNTCSYADKVVKQINRLKAMYVLYALEGSKRIVSERLGVSLDELEGLKVTDLKKYYHKKVMLLHPDKNQQDPKAGDKFGKVNRAWGDFVELNKLKQRFEHELEDAEAEAIKKDALANFDEADIELPLDDDDELPVMAKQPKKGDLAAHQFKQLLGLPAPAWLKYA